MWEARFAGSDGYLFGTQPAQFITENPGLFQPGQRALVVADGEGRNSVALALMGLTVTAFDLSPTAVDRARALAERAGAQVDYYCSPWADWDWSQSFDLVLGAFIQFTMPAERVQHFTDMRRACAPGGRVILHGYTPEQVALGTGGPPRAEQMYTPDLLRHHFGDWRIERLAAYERDVQEGSAHVGRSALIDMVARRP
jgi:SAM-dependent methyltransferase